MKYYREKPSWNLAQPFHTHMLLVKIETTSMSDDKLHHSYNYVFVTKCSNDELFTSGFSSNSVTGKVIEERPIPVSKMFIGATHILNVNNVMTGERTDIYAREINDGDFVLNDGSPIYDFKIVRELELSITCNQCGLIFKSDSDICPQCYTTRSLPKTNTITPIPSIKPEMCSFDRCISNVTNVGDVYCSKHARPAPIVTPEHTGLSVSYYDVVIPANSHTNPDHNQPLPVVVSCNDIIEALNMNYACANVFKAVWRICAAKLGKMKKGNNTFYDAEKAVFFSDRILNQEKHNDG